MTDEPRSDRERGTTVSLAPPGASNAPGILVVDDDQIVLSLLKTVLVRQGFQVWTSASGHDALDVFRRHQDHVAVVLLDVCMPGLDGPRTLAHLRQIGAVLRPCFMSGHTGAYSVEDLRNLGALHFFEKPFQVLPMAEQLWEIARSEVRRSA